MLVSHNKRFRRRRGVSSLFETSICVVSLAVILAGLINILSINGFLTAKTIVEANNTVDTEEFVNIVRNDVKSSTKVEVFDTDYLIVTTPSDIITYDYDATNDIISKNNKPLVKGVVSCSFVSDNLDEVVIHMKSSDGVVYDFVVFR